MTTQSTKDKAAVILIVFLMAALLLWFTSCNTPRRCIEPEPIGAYHNYTTHWVWYEVDDSVTLQPIKK